MSYSKSRVVRSFKIAHVIYFSFVTRTKGVLSIKKLYGWDSAASGICIQRQHCIKLSCVSFYLVNDCNCLLFIKSKAEGRKMMLPVVLWESPSLLTGGSISTMASIQHHLPASSHWHGPETRAVSPLFLGAGLQILLINAERLPWTSALVE